MPRVKLFDEEEVLNKAMCLFWRQGYAATSVQDLVSYLGINRASLYSTFGDKEQLFKKAFALYKKNNLEVLTHFFESKSNIKEAFSELFNNAIEEAKLDKEKRGCFVVNTITELIPNDESFQEVILKNKSDIERVFYTYLQKGKENGDLKTTQDLKAIAALLYTVYCGIQVVSKIDADKQELSNAVGVAMSLLV